jgi:4-amino-4-deoxy-L-arabinose transferase-like glycosyltransferase
MWFDEAGLALSFLRIEYANLLRPLPVRAQQAPPLFNLVALSLVEHFGPSEYVFRFLPLLASLASLPLFLLVARRMLSERGALIAIWLYVGTPLAIRYAGEFKPYASDRFVTISLLAIALAVRRTDFEPRVCALATVVGAAFVWASYTSIFLLAGIGMALLHEAATTPPIGPRTRIALLCGMGGLGRLPSRASGGSWIGSLR